MRKIGLRIVCASIATAACFTATVRADVTLQQNTALNVASLMRMHGVTTTTLTADKRREDTEAHCEGMMSLLCGNVQSGDIVRLDKNVTWHLEPKKKRYVEQAFATPEELAAMRAKMQANMEKMRSCPVSQKQQPIDKSKCEMAPPKFEVHKTDSRASIAGHDTQLTSATVTESCTNKDTGEVCDTIVAVDVWLTQDKLPGTGDRTAFDAAYAKKLGLTETLGVMRGQAAKFLAPYQSQIKQLTDKSADFKGQPMKTSFRVLVGGRQCTSAAKSKDDASSADSGGANPMASAAQAGKALGSLVGGMFHKKKTDDSSDAASAPAAPPAAAVVPTTPDPYAQYYSQMAAFSVETVSISSEAVPADRFEVPADWTKETPKAAKDDEEYTCPKT
jgi:hypothetical protein